jgi:AraC-like DNA-binding protein
MIPDGHSEIVLNRGSAAFARWKLDAPHRCAEMRRSYLIGGRSHSVSTRSLQPLSLAGVKLDPRFLRRITGVPLDEFRDDTLELREFGDASLLDLEDQVAGARDAAGVVACFDRHFLARIGAASPPANAADALARHIHATRGVVSILEWARQTGVDSRHLERSFARDFGMTPKKYARVVRFKHLYRRLLGTPRGMSLASQIGAFYDQSHFNREFRYFTGTAPSVLLEGRGTEDFSVSDHLLRSED